MEKPTIKVTPNPSYAIDRVLVCVSGLQPNSPVTLHAITTLESGNQFESTAFFISTSEGVLDLERNESIGGSYYGVDSMGFLWAMTPSSDNKKPNARFIKRDPNVPMEVIVSLYQGHVDDLNSTKLNPLVRGLVIRTYKSKYVEEVVLDTGSVKGYLYLPIGRDKYPGILNLYGAVEGTYRVKPCVLASHGFVVLGLIYLGDEVGNKINLFEIELEYFQIAVNFLRNHPRVDSSMGVGINAISTGTSIALSMAAFGMDGIKCMAIANGPIYASIPNFTYQGVQVAEPASFHTEENYRFVLHMPTSPFSKQGTRHIIPFYANRKVAVLYLSCMADAVIDIETISNHLKEIKKYTGRSDINVIEYKNAGHLLEIPYMPLTSKCYFPYMAKVENFGGWAKEHMMAQIQSWNDIVCFFKQELPNMHHKL